MSARIEDCALVGDSETAALLAMLGNFPQAFSHVGLIDSALDLSRPAVPHQPSPAGQRARTGPSSDRDGRCTVGRGAHCAAGFTSFR